ncbi:HTH-type transcriptional regulator CysL [Pigmentiphaga humi]|uniref:HTH-type transcriptional regulator CysL n=1 Tax=Pigmentiphaga humi TaxID=2478468 RepID=A0A3P4AX90_9BURK|nr:LysR substrate-binding domain-containing protein [Pigmentiphaga humi]VCU68000.1 HTH-type transcriptional regulator CysL [Pigmentiphaga humi]
MRFRFDLTDLQLFLHVVAAGSITGGSERVHLSLASGSARLRQMEEALGTPLLERGRRGVAPTAAGEALARHARLMLQEADRLVDDLGGYARGLRGQVRLWANSSAAAEHLPEPLADFLVAHPDMDVDLQHHPSHRTAQAVREGVADLGVVSDAMDLAGLARAPFRDDPLVLLAPRGHPLAGRGTVRFGDTLEHDYVGLGAANALALHLEDHALRAGRRMRLRVRAETAEALVRMVARGAGLGIVPRASLGRGRHPELVRLALGETWANRRLVLCARDFAALPGHARALVQALRSDAPQSAV